MRTAITGFAICVLALGQERLPGGPGEQGGNLPARPVGASDLLAVSVYGAPELTRTVRVGAEGSIRMPMLRRVVTVGGLMPSEVERRIASALTDEKILVDPAVTVTIAEYAAGKPISIAGAVRHPLTFQVHGPTTLLEAITRAEGLSPEAGDEILVTRPGAPIRRIAVKDLIEGSDPESNLALEGGEDVRVPDVGRVFVVGNVKKPGAFPMGGTAGMTVLKALAMAEGLAPFSTKEAYIYRPDGGLKKEVPVMLRKILDRKAPDVALSAGDILYVQPPAGKGSKGSNATEHYFHFDSWRVNVAPGEWVPAQIYVEEEGSGKTPRFKAQTRIWDYAAAPSNKLDELTKILIESNSQLNDQANIKDLSPLESQRSWERQAEENVLARLEKGGLLAPPGSVDELLNTVVNNLIVSANLNIDARCRVLLTTPIETFSIGHTIVISRGLIDVLPDEASLALVLADELSHIALGHRTPTQFAFNNQTLLSDAELLKQVHFDRTPQEMQEAGKKTIEIMRASPYQKTANAGLFLKALSGRGTVLPRLLAANLGNQVANASALARLAEFAASAPELEEGKLEQIAALPLGSRVKLNPWNDQITLVKTRPIALLSAREKMPFEVTPFVLFLTRVEELADSAH